MTAKEDDGTRSRRTWGALFVGAGPLPESARRSRTGARRALERELARADREIAHLGEDASVRRKGVARELAELDGSARLAALDGKRLTAVLRAGAADVQPLLGQNVPQARQMLRKVLVGRLACEAFVEVGRARLSLHRAGHLLAARQRGGDGDRARS